MTPNRGRATRAKAARPTGSRGSDLRKLLQQAGVALPARPGVARGSRGRGSRDPRDLAQSRDLTCTNAVIHRVARSTPSRSRDPRQNRRSARRGVARFHESYSLSYGEGENPRLTSGVPPRRRGMGTNPPTNHPPHQLQVLDTTRSQRHTAYRRDVLGAMAPRTSPGPWPPAEGLRRCRGEAHGSPTLHRLRHTSPHHPMPDLPTPTRPRPQHSPLVVRPRLPRRSPTPQRHSHHLLALRPTLHPSRPLHHRPRALRRRVPGPRPRPPHG